MLSSEDFEGRDDKEDWSRFEILLDAVEMVYEMEMLEKARKLSGQTAEARPLQETKMKEEEEGTHDHDQMGTSRKDKSLKEDVPTTSDVKSPKTVLKPDLFKKPVPTEKDKGKRILMDLDYDFSQSSSSAYPYCPIKGLKEPLVSEKLKASSMKALKRPCPDDSMSGQTHRKKLRQSFKNNDDDAGPRRSTTPPAMLEEPFRRRIEAMGGTDIKLLIEKNLFATDLKRNECRLSMPVNQIKADFLKDHEKKILDTYTSPNKLMEVQVTILIEPNLHQSSINLKKWNYGNKGSKGKKSFSYMLNGTWLSVAKRNDLWEGDRIQVWSFRIGTDLCMAIVCKNRIIARCSGTKPGCSELERAGSDLLP